MDPDLIASQNDLLQSGESDFPAGRKVFVAKTSMIVTGVIRLERLND